MARPDSAARPKADDETPEIIHPLAYVRAVRPEEIAPPGALPEGITVLYAVHDESGKRLAVFDDRDNAFLIARQNNFAPVSAH